jgi:Sulfotransferase family
MGGMLFEEAELLEAARRETGLDDFGPGHFRDGLGVLIRALSTEAKLKPEAVPYQRQRILEQLSKRLRLQDCFTRHPEILQEKVEKPIFILGSPRSGSSIMHELWSLDPANRTPQAWEVYNPLPPPETASYHTDPRIAERQGHFDAIYAMMPALRSMHRMGATLPSEDVEITSMDFASVVFFVDTYLPSYSRWLYDEVDYAPVFAGLRRYLQLLQWRAPGAPWVLKSLYNMHYMKAFLAEFPDARIIWLHRDPLAAMGSGAHLALTMTMGQADGLDPVAVARDIAHWSVMQHERSVDVQESGMLRPEQFVNIRFPDFVKDQVATIAGIYAHFGMELRPEIARKMRDYLAQHTAEEHGKHTYSLGDLGLDAAEYRRKFERYQAYFGVGGDKTV